MNSLNLVLTTEAAPRRREVEDKLRTAIVDGRLEPGQRLVERELCEALNVSRTSLREAFRQLEAEGLVKVLPYRGPVVATLAASDAEQTYRIREVLEALAGQSFVEHATDAQFAALRQAYSDLSAATQRKQVQSVLESKDVFYRLLFEGSGNVYVRDVLHQLNNRIRLLRATSLSAPGRLPKMIREMRKIMQAIEARDTDLVWQACAEHVRSAAAVALPALRKAEAASHSLETRAPVKRIRPIAQR